MNDNSVEQAQAAFYKHPNYHTALALQKAKRAAAIKATEARKEWFEIEGDAGQHSIPDVEVLVSAMREILRSFNEHKIEDSIGNTFLYIKKVAEQSLIAIGRKDQ